MSEEECSNCEKLRAKNESTKAWQDRTRVALMYASTERDSYKKALEFVKGELKWHRKRDGCDPGVIEKAVNEVLGVRND